MKIVITGGKGMLGRTLQRVLSDQQVYVADLPEVDICDAAGLDHFLAEVAPDVVLHCAAMTAVDKCESDADLAYKLNAVGSGNVAAACHRRGVRLVAISTDYVFDGELDRPYHEFDAAGGARSVYGQSKYAGEEMVRRHCPNHVICRISWLYGAGGPSFVHSMMALADGNRPVLKVVNDQRGNPTSALAVSRRLADILARPELVGTFHLTCEGEASWYEFAQEIFRLAGVRQDVVPCTTAEFPRPAPRPANSRLEKRMLRLCGMAPMPDWHDALAEFMREESLGK
ncbi:dTDP-4-dehydrorhamnose reductase [Oligosphaera ethanolica]|uniref:dTDP-4-dehydrorhamnose reductase n=1 Tax=Oligosphaera ethanolica TaxID=760260 RepID=A0AAE3VG03_9BACT|nr:dTDP-4-dehydrorhamnose reductase [Oligosphaera ethanolica]MDQ0289844.1 dTDP-4-dehydrorhamnose reductase [Oligosphaera ethanolica]